MLAVPLFHVHPDADHLHGRAGHLHGGTVHTVMSPDLECEVESHSSLTAASHDVSTSLAGLGHRHLEIEFSLLTDSDRKSYSLFLSQAHALWSAVSVNLEPRVSQELEAIALFSPTWLLYDLPSRGPPSLSA
jgi:hypothetical protein